MKQDGFLLLSDITGYSDYLNKSELEHAHESLSDLLNLLIKRTESPLQIFKLEGDAVFAYAPAGAFHQGQTLLEALENTYLAFRKALDLMIINTTCTCDACRNIPNLDLKFFVHFGAYTVQELGDYRELLGNDVNLVHRITKNRISEELGKMAYAAITQNVVEVLEMDELVAEMETITDSYADVGEIKLYVQDMHQTWENRKDETRVLVDPQDAAFVLESVFPLPPPQLWDYITRPDFRAIFAASDTDAFINDSGSRIGEGAVYMCAHGEKLSKHTILDWQPFEQYTYRQTFPDTDFYNMVTLRLTPEGEGTLLTYISGNVDPPGDDADQFSADFTQDMTRKDKHFFEPLTQKIKVDVENGSASQAPRIILGEALVEQAVNSSLKPLAK
jgi:uncharacterized protein YndB with AHSA1/START domain